MSADLEARLRERARLMNGAMKSGGLYLRLGDYADEDAALDTEAAAALASQRAEIEKRNARISELEADRDRWAKQALKEDDCRKMWQARATELEAALAEAEADRDRLNFLDELNASLNAHYGTKYRWEMVINHNVNRLMFNLPYGVDLNDAKAHQIEYYVMEAFDQPW